MIASSEDTRSAGAADGVERLSETGRVTKSEPDAAARRPNRIVIVGGGFGGLACASKLSGAPVEVTLLDKRNHNLFQPLLYQIATAILSPADISEPLRRTLGKERNVDVVMAEVVGIDAKRKAVLTRDGAPVEYDTLVIATGSVDNYLGHDEWKQHAPGLKTNRDARQVRETLLLAFERAELTLDPDERRKLLTFVIVGGGPTGVELAGRTVVCVGASRIVGKPVAVLLMQAEATVVSTNVHTPDLASFTREADIVVTAAGVPGLLTGDMVKPGSVVVDVGINRVPDPETGRTRTVGDVDFDSVSAVAGWLSPVPGGVGPMTVAMLLRNTVDAATSTV